MKLRELKAIIDREPAAHLDFDVKVWLPGSRISLTGSTMLLDPEAKRTVMVEGNVEEGSALISESDSRFTGIASRQEWEE